MIKMINRVTGSEMMVADSRIVEYLGRGHKIAPAPDGKPEKATHAEMTAVRRKRKK